MGANQSSQQPPVETPPPPPVSLSSLNNAEKSAQAGGAETTTTTKTKKNKKKNKKEQELTGFALVQYKCRRKRRAYDKCYATWYGGNFVTGQNVNNREESCDDLFDEWRECILVGMKKDRENRGLPPPDKDSMLGEVDEDE
mmetsp:Transcript_4935/g.7485  ORF Transcript_4935/g.7485 Transcript_4935/m.7485 type:complete len:141 (-) Transcript_4935:237-659(-)|eukprot:CAMPEP_0195285600 /NCGR_PEP_ID=MMETSP0707-20130614/3374_1 /TAXON_ID=33640 /ORGANISM="Asterionellopsis glacialis, Strain CCMP134" /LENGTH=140 /DNA_ID=CAMNT_0040345119 /DNA_START=160 /DNA_END=582 /DNA_ORIENTATION=-